MKRYLAFASPNLSGDVTLDDFVGDFDNVFDAKAAVEKREPDGMCVYENGAVLDMTSGEVRDWTCAPGPTGDDRWYSPRPMGAR